MIRLIGLIAALVCAAGPVLAQDWKTAVEKAQATTFSGCYIGAQVGYGATNYDTTLDVTGTPPFSGTALQAPFSSQGGSIGAHVGCDMQIQKFIVGAFADYSWLSQKMEVTSPILAGLGGGALNPIARIDLDTSWTVGGRAGLVIAPSTAAYVLLGYTKMTTSDGLTLLGTAGGTFAMPSFEGWTYGGGLMTEISKGIRLSAEYRMTRFDRVDVSVIPNALSVGIQPDMHTAMARLSYSFNFGQ